MTTTHVAELHEPHAFFPDLLRSGYCHIANTVNLYCRNSFSRVVLMYVRPVEEVFDT